MASLDSLPPDQRAVLQMVLSRGRGYDDIASMLSIDRAGVRDRALAALDALGPATRISADRRHLITDYLLGQLPPRVAEETRRRLAQSPSERAWARVVAAELRPLASGPLPEIPVEVPEPEPVAAPAAARPSRGAVHEPEPVAAPAAPRVSRRGGAILLGLGAAIVVAVVVVFVVVGSGGGHHAQTSPAKATAGAPTSTRTAATPVAQINLISPTGTRKTAGIAEVLRQGSRTAVVIVGQGLPANTTKNAYAVWLYNSPTDAVRLGFVNPGVGRNGRLETAGPLPTNAGHYRQLLVTLETSSTPKSPGQVVLEGNLTGV